MSLAAAAAGPVAISTVTPSDSSAGVFALDAPRRAHAVGDRAIGLAACRDAQRQRLHYRLRRRHGGCAWRRCWSEEHRRYSFSVRPPGPATRQPVAPASAARRAKHLVQVVVAARFGPARREVADHHAHLRLHAVLGLVRAQEVDQLQCVRSAQAFALGERAGESSDQSLRWRTGSLRQSTSTSGRRRARCPSVM